jgi:hypothetical protein
MSWYHFLNIQLPSYSCDGTYFKTALSQNLQLQTYIIVELQNLDEYSFLICIVM